MGLFVSAVILVASLEEWERETTKRYLLNSSLRFIHCRLFISRDSFPAESMMIPIFILPLLFLLILECLSCLVFPPSISIILFFPRNSNRVTRFSSSSSSSLFPSFLSFNVCLHLFFFFLFSGRLIRYSTLVTFIPCILISCDLIPSLPSNVSRTSCLCRQLLLLLRISSKPPSLLSCHFLVLHLRVRSCFLQLVFPPP